MISAGPCQLFILTIARTPQRINKAPPKKAQFTLKSDRVKDANWPLSSPGIICSDSSCSRTAEKALIPFTNKVLTTAMTAPMHNALMITVSAGTKTAVLEEDEAMSLPELFIYSSPKAYHNNHSRQNARRNSARPISQDLVIS